MIFNISLYNIIDHCFFAFLYHTIISLPTIFPNICNVPLSTSYLVKTKAAVESNYLSYFLFRVNNNLFHCVMDKQTTFFRYL